MDWRTLAVLLIMLFLIGPPLLMAELVANPPSGNPEIPTPVYLFLLWFMLLSLLAILILAASLYFRLKPYRTTLRIFAAFIVYLVFLSWWLGPVGLGSARESLSQKDMSFIRISATILLFWLLVEIEDNVRRFKDEEQ
ncbi:MAG: hypothetical protein ABEH59_09690 [Halobacteriales archaeon]